jgi:predicted regulator of Ras-like GTPase activity (Roadblock/LC7/MglB family)
MKEQAPMTVVKLKVDPDQTPQEEAELVARVAAAVAESTGESTVRFELEKSEDVQVAGSVAQRMSRGARWGA